MLISIYTIFVAFDLFVVVFDAKSPGTEGNKVPFVKTAYKILIWVQSALSLLILIGYGILFILFLLLFRKVKERADGESYFAGFRKHVISFFGVMLFILVSNFVLDVVFYDEFDRIYESGGVIAQEKLVSITTYIHSIMEIVFDVVLLSFLIQ